MFEEKDEDSFGWERWVPGTYSTWSVPELWFLVRFPSPSDSLSDLTDQSRFREIVSRVKNDLSLSGLPNTGESSIAVSLCLSFQLTSFFEAHSDYQVYLGNNRGVFDMGHAWLKRSDPRFWGTLSSLLQSRDDIDCEDRVLADYNIKELALYDLPAMVDHVRRDTGYDKVRLLLSFRLDLDAEERETIRSLSLDTRKETQRCSVRSVSSHPVRNSPERLLTPG